MADKGSKLPARQERELDVYQGDDFFPIGSLFGGSAWQSIRRIHDEMDRVFDRLLGGGAQGQTLQGWAPSTDISEDKDGWCVEVDLPGVKKDDIDVQVNEHQLIIHADMRQESEQEGAPGEGREERQYHRRERRYGHFERVMTLPDNVTEDKISCDFKDGVLTVRVPKAEKREPEGRKIPISSEASGNGHDKQK